MTTATLSHLLATSATGYGAVIDGILDIRTVTEAPNGAALNALYVKGFRITSSCQDQDCNCMVKILARLAPDVRLVAVSVQVAE
jgi:hypothetical protein